MNGQRQKLLNQVRMLKGMFPEDPNYVFMDAMLLVLDDRQEEAEQLLQSIGDRVSEAELDASLRHLRLLGQMLDVLRGAADDKASLADLLPVLRQADQLASVLGRGERVEQLAPLSGVTGYPVMQPMVKSIPTLSLKLLTFPALARADIEQLMAAILCMSCS